MIELFEQDIKLNDRQSSKGNQLKWKKNTTWYKADYTGYEGLSEYIISQLLLYTNLNSSEFVIYEPIEIKYKSKKFNGVSSQDFLNDSWQIITLERLFKNYYGESLNKAIWNIKNPKERLSFLVNNVKRITGLQHFGKYMNKILTIDAFFLNEDRHTHNIAVLMNDQGQFDYCPIFDNGAGLLADTLMDYPLEGDVYKLIDSVKGKTFSLSLEEQLEISEELYGMNILFNFNKNDVENIFSNMKLSDMYSHEIINRIKIILYEQMRKYPYLFK